MTSGTFPGQRKFPVSLFKGSPRPLGRARFGAHVGGQGRQRQTRGAVRSGSCPAPRELAAPEFHLGNPDGVGSQEGVTAVYGIHRSPEPDC